MRPGKRSGRREAILYLQKVLSQASRSAVLSVANHFCCTAPVRMPPRLLFTVTLGTAGDSMNAPLYLPPPELSRVPMNAPVVPFHAVNVAVALVLVAST